MRPHDLFGVVDVLDRVARLRLFRYGRYGDSVGFREDGHRVRLDHAIVCGGSGEDQVRAYSTLIFPDSFHRSLALLGRRRTVG